jgi:4-carboxymuconolactone decarboxylase
MYPNPTARHAGLHLLDRLHGEGTGHQLMEAMKDISPDFVTMTIEWATAGIMARPGLDLLTREYLIIASCVTLGHATPQLRAHIEAALRLGATRAQVVEAILQVLFYAGGAAVANALVIADETFKHFVETTYCKEEDPLAESCQPR